MPTEHTRVFVSYTRRDFYFAEQLAVALRRRDLAVWFDVHELAMGTDWSAAIERAIDDCDAVVLVASRAAVASAYVRSECDRARRLGRPVVAVLRERVTLPTELAVPRYDLRSSFRRGVAELAGDLGSGGPLGRTHRRRLPLPLGALLVAAAPALCLAFVAALTIAFLAAVSGQVAVVGPSVVVALAEVGVVTALVAGVSAYTLVTFLRRSISWRYLRGAFVTLPLLALSAVVAVAASAGYLTDPLLAALGGADADPLSPVPIALALLVTPACLLAGLASELSAGLGRHLRTGVAPRRIRTRHLGTVPRPAIGRGAVHTVRLVATDADAGVAETVRRHLDGTGIEQVDGDSRRDRDIVVVSDASPADWLSRADFCDPIAVVATSICCPLGDALGRFQWVDYRARRNVTMLSLARDLTTAGGQPASDRSAPDVPERLQLLRMPRWVAVTEWMVFCLGVLAAQVGAYGLTRLILADQHELGWLPCCAAALAPLPFLLARRLRHRRLTLRSLLAAIAVYWVLMIALGADSVLQQEYPIYDRGSYSATTIIYSVLSALILLAASRSLRGWLPGRLRPDTPTGSAALPGPTLGHVRGSWVWLAILLPALVSAVAAAALGT